MQSNSSSTSVLEKHDFTLSWLIFSGHFLPFVKIIASIAERVSNFERNKVEYVELKKCKYTT
jgi:hypothetical protein